MLIASIIGVGQLWQHPSWPSDGFVYAEMMLKDAGAPAPLAESKARDFYLQTPVGKDTRFRPYFLNLDRGLFSAESKPFAARLVYPYLASRLYPYFGFSALIAISVSAYVLTALCLYALTALFVKKWLAAIVTSLFVASPLFRGLGASALTDMLAIALWSAILLVGVLYLRNPQTIWAVLFALLCVFLGLTRPAVYLPLGFALGALLAARPPHTQRDRSPAIVLTVCALLAGASYWVAAHITHTPGISSHLHWLFHLARTGWFYSNPRVLSSAEYHSFAVWYAHEVVWTFVFALGKLVKGIIPIFALGVALYALIRESVAPEIAGLLGAGILGVFALAANPVLTEVPRLIEAPLYPVVAVGVAIFASHLMHRAPGRPPATSPAHPSS